MSTTVYDFAIIGAGAAGGQLALAMAKDPWFQNRKILLIDKDPKELNDRTWCFWEKENGDWDDIVHKTWKRGAFHTDQLSMEFEMDPYQYKMVRSSDYYRHLHEKIEGCPYIHWVTGNASTVLLDGALAITVDDEKYLANHLFDSRIHPDYHKADDRHLRVLQHFKGWIVKTEKPVFNPDQFTMMDFRKPHNHQTAFNYLLPLSENEALIEYTFFTESIVEESIYEQNMDRYLRNEVGCKEYTIVDEEKGVIPMTNYPFHSENNFLVTKIGTGGGWVRPSTGYSFRKTSEYVSKIILNLKKGEVPSMGLFQYKYHLFDTLFLDILHRNNKLGPGVFETLYANNPPQRILKFLDGNTTFWEDLKIMASVKAGLFMKSIYRQFILRV